MTAQDERPPQPGRLIVCGLGRVGCRIVGLLTRLGERGVVITRETGSEWCLEHEEHFPVIQGDARDEELLRRAGIAEARAILVVTDDNLANVSIALDARRINPGIVIVVRLFDQELAGHLERSLEIRRALSTSALAAPVFAAATLGATVRGTFEAGGASWIVEERVADPESTSTGREIGHWTAECGRAVIALERAGAVTPKPALETRILPGDRLTTVRFARSGEKLVPAGPGPDPRAGAVSACRATMLGIRRWWWERPMCPAHGLGGLAGRRGRQRPRLPRWAGPVAGGFAVFRDHHDHHDRLRRLQPEGRRHVDEGVWNLRHALRGGDHRGTLQHRDRPAPRHAVPQRHRRSCAECKGHIVVAGLGSIGFRLVRELARRGETVAAIEQRNSGEFIQAARHLASVVLGNAKTEETLFKAGVAGAKAVVAATNDDLTNLSIGLAAKRANPACRVVLRMFDSDLAEKMQHGLGVDAVLSASAAAAPTFVGSVLCPDVLQGILLHDYLVLVFCRTIEAGSPLVGTSGPGDGRERVGLLRETGRDHRVSTRRLGARAGRGR